MKAELENKVGKDDRSRLITNSINEKLRKQFPIKRDNKVYSAATKTVNDTYYENKWEIPADTKPYDKNCSPSRRNVTGTDFLKFVKDQEKGNNTIKPVSQLTDNLY
jgi:peptidyl-prolyl cis-trans isomerase SurA